MASADGDMGSGEELVDVLTVVADAGRSPSDRPSGDGGESRAVLSKASPGRSHHVSVPLSAPAAHR